MKLLASFDWRVTLDLSPAKHPPVSKVVIKYVDDPIPGELPEIANIPFPEEGFLVPLSEFNVRISKVTDSDLDEIVRFLNSFDRESTRPKWLDFLRCLDDGDFKRSVRRWLTKCRTEGIPMKVTDPEGNVLALGALVSPQSGGCGCLVFSVSSGCENSGIVELLLNSLLYFADRLPFDLVETRIPSDWIAENRALNRLPFRAQLLYGYYRRNGVLCYDTRFVRERPRRSAEATSDDWRYE